jgi:hypothetical protein
MQSAHENVRWAWVSSEFFRDYQSVARKRKSASSALKRLPSEDSVSEKAREMADSRREKHYCTAKSSSKHVLESKKEGLTQAPALLLMQTDGRSEAYRFLSASVVGYLEGASDRVCRQIVCIASLICS